MQWFTSPNINFIGNRRKAFIFSGILLLATVASLIFHKGPNFSIDFVGGTLVQIQFARPLSAEQVGEIRAAISELFPGIPEVKRIGFGEGGELQIIVKRQTRQGSVIGDEIKAALKKGFPDNPFELRREEKVGPKIGNELKVKALAAIGLSLLAIVVYIAVRFKLPFGIAAIIALFHDVVITVGVFSFVNAEMSLPIIAALLTIVGYSLNDTIVVFDRIRENLGGGLMAKSFEDRLNISINQCLSRTIITSLTTLFVVIALYAAFFATRDVIKDFSLALLVGVLIGTYSSVFIASPFLVFWNRKWPIR